MSELNDGAVYNVSSQRKGNFVGRLINHDDIWATLEIMEGKAGAMLAYNERGKGEEVTVRRSMATLTERKPE